eukprot:3712090-Pyramimonas_sp.AAC.2
MHASLQYNHFGCWEDNHFGHFGDFGHFGCWEAFEGLPQNGSRYLETASAANTTVSALYHYCTCAVPVYLEDSVAVEKKMLRSNGATHVVVTLHKLNLRTGTRTNRHSYS